MGPRFTLSRYFLSKKRCCIPDPPKNTKKTKMFRSFTKMCRFWGPGPGGNNSLFRSFLVPALTFGPPWAQNDPRVLPKEPQDPLKHDFRHPFYRFSTYFYTMRGHIEVRFWALLTEKRTPKNTADIRGIQPCKTQYKPEISAVAGVGRRQLG